jgi:hypothetical protein
MAFESQLAPVYKTPAQGKSLKAGLISPVKREVPFQEELQHFYEHTGMQAVVHAAQ